VDVEVAEETEKPKPQPLRPPAVAEYGVASLEAIVRDRSKLRTAFALSEVLAPPLALREDGAEYR
jgi:hypothetical protein